MSSSQTPLDPAELSALIDGELSPDRARVVEAMLARDPALKAEFDALRAQDAGWREAAGDATFVPAVRLPQPAPAAVTGPGLAAVVLLLLAARFGGKFIEALGPSLLLNLAALVLVGVAVLAAARADGDGAPVSARRR
jgi:anti-sigma factor RsiW